MARFILSSPHITKIGVGGFKSISRPQAIEVRPLTILAGTNSSGKSSIMQPLLLMKQTLEATYDPGPLLLNGPNVRFTLAKQLFSLTAAAQQRDQFTVEIATDMETALINRFQRDEATGIAIAATTYVSREKGRYTLTSQANDDELMAVPWVRDYARGHKNQNIPVWIARYRCLLAVETEMDLWEYSDHEDSQFKLRIENIIHLPGLRGSPARTYPRTATDGPHFVGTFDNYVASLIHSWGVSNNKKLGELRFWMQQLGLASSIEANPLDDTAIEIRVGRLPRIAGIVNDDNVSIADVGLGVSQVLPVLVALITADPGQLVYIEQPELHLHPRAQSALAQLFAAAAQRGVRVVVETHSSLFLLGVQTLIAEEKLAPDLVKLHWFRRDDAGATEITSSDLDESGAFDIDWPEDFAEVVLQAESRYLDAAEARHLQIRR